MNHPAHASPPAHGHRATDIHLLTVGEFIGIDLRRLAAILNARQSSFHFYYIDESNDELRDLSSCEVAGTAFFNPDEIGQAILRAEVAEFGPDAAPANRIIIGFTGVWLADSVDAASPPTTDDVYLGYWQNRFCRTASDPRIAVISIAPWLNRYERVAYRDVYQYAAFMISAYLGDYVTDGTMTHSDFRWCVFDFNPDLDSVVDSIRKSRLCDRCRTRLDSVQDDGRPPHPTRAIEALLRYSRRPKWGAILRALQDDAFFSLFISGLLLSVTAGIVANVFSQSNASFSIEMTAALFSLILVLLLVVIVIKNHFKPGGRLG